MRSVHTIPFGLKGGPRALEAIVHDTGRDGPRVAITANVHGDEATGLATVLSLDTWLSGNLRRGVVRLYPSLNPVGLRGCHRETSPMGADLNRLFPGNSRGDVPDRLASKIWQELCAQSFDLLLDLHADSLNAIPYTIVDQAIRLSGRRRSAMQRRLLEVADASGLTVLTEYPDEKYRRFALDKSLAGAMVNHADTPALTLECGPRRAISGAAVEAMEGAVRGILGHLGLVDFEMVPHSTRAPGRFQRASVPRVSGAGIFLPAVAPGAFIEKGMVLGQIRALDGSVSEEVVAPESGIVISWLEAAWVERHGVVGTLGIRQ
jgi:uncharacterized protein